MKWNPEFLVAVYPQGNGKSLLVSDTMYGCEEAKRRFFRKHKTASKILRQDGSKVKEERGLSVSDLPLHTQRVTGANAANG
jgi:hypothetical protein